jgi:uncharacterized protein YjbI with pentapeptide repeats
MSKFQGMNRRALVFLGGCAVAVGVAFLTSQSASAAAAVTNCQAVAAANVDWSGCDLSLKNLSSKVLTGANFTGATLDRANLTNANLTNANLTNVDFGSSTTLTGATMTGATMTGAYTWYVSTSPAAFPTDWKMTTGFSCGMAGPGVNYSNATLRTCDFSKMNLTGANFAGSTLTGTNFTGSNLTGANFAPQTSQQYTDISGANFKGANLTNAKLPFISSKSSPYVDKDATTIWTGAKCLVSYNSAGRAC